MTKAKKSKYYSQTYHLRYYDKKEARWRKAFKRWLETPTVLKTNQDARIRG